MKMKWAKQPIKGGKRPIEVERQPVKAMVLVGARCTATMQGSFFFCGGFFLTVVLFLQWDGKFEDFSGPQAKKTQLRAEKPTVSNKLSLQTPPNTISGAIGGFK